jgi:hypothetical protein
MSTKRAGGLDLRDFQEMLYSNMDAMDPLGWIATRGEWLAFW